MRPRARFTAAVSAAMIAFVACGDAPTSPAVALTPGTLPGSRVVTTRGIDVRATAGRNAPIIGSQARAATGTVIGGPTTVTSTDRQERWEVDFDQGVDGWVQGRYLNTIATAPPPPPPAEPVASVAITPSSASLTTGDRDTLTATLRDSAGTVLAGRTIAWSTNDASVTTVSSGVVTAVGPGSATITATSEGFSDIATIAVSAVPIPPPPPGSLMFSSDWRTALGSGDSALLDMGKAVPWNLVAGNGSLNAVITSTGLDFPTANVLRVIGGWRVSPAGAAAENPRLAASAGHLTIPDVGQSMYYRWYIRVAAPNEYTVDALTHPIQDGTNGSVTNWMFEVTNRTDGTWGLSWNVSGNGQNAWPDNRWFLAFNLQKHQTYRIELQVHRIGTSTYNLHARVSDAANVPIAGDANFRNADGSATLAGLHTLTFNNLAYLAGFQAGFNGLSGGVQADYPILLYYQGGFAITSAGWPGVYGSIEGER